MVRAHWTSTNSLRFGREALSLEAIPGLVRGSPKSGKQRQGRIQDFYWVGAAGPRGAVLAIEGAPFINQNQLFYFAKQGLLKPSRAL